MALVREGFARKLNLRNKKVVLLIQVVRQEWSRWETTQYTVTMVDRHAVKAYNMEFITSPTDIVLLDDIMHKFPDDTEARRFSSDWDG